MKKESLLYLKKNRLLLISNLHIWASAFLFITAVQFSHAAVFFQASKKFENASVEYILNQIEATTNYKFSYKIEDVDLARKVSLSAGTGNMNLLMEQLFKNTGTTYTIDGKHIFLAKRKSSGAVIKVNQDAEQRQSTIRGIVTDSKGLPLSGVFIQLDKSLLGTVTTEKGTFSLINEEGSTYLTASLLGFVSQKIPLKDKVQFSIVMKEDVTELDAVELTVNTGMSKRDVKSYTGAAITMSGEQLKQISPNNVFNAITAMDPSIRILPNNIAGGNINNMPTINIRGTNSFPNLTGELSADPNTPLFILDGFQVDIERIYDLDINMIKSVTILKDATATAIYGSRGANGVMVFTTITPKAGKLRVTFNNDFNILDPDLSVYKYLNSTQKLDFEKRAGVYDSDYADLQYVNNVLYNTRLKAVKSGVDTDWKKIPIRTGYGNQSSLYIQGGDETIRYGGQVAADFQSGVMKKQDRDNYSGQFDFSYRHNKIRFSNSIRIFQNVANESSYGNFDEYLKLNPYWYPYDENGNAKQYLEQLDIANRRFTTTNPLYDATLNSVNQTKYFGYSNNFQFHYDILPSLFVESSLSINKRNTQKDEFYSAQDSRFAEIEDVNQKGSYTVTNTNTMYYENLTSLNYNFSKNKNQFFSMFAFNLSSTVTDYYSMVTTGFPYDKLDNLLFAAQYQENGKPTGDESTVRRVGFVYSGNYSYDNRFLVDVSARRDGSSQYGSDNRFGWFWSAGLGWNIHNEKLFKDLEWMNRFKIRGSYGSTGSTNIPAYGAQTRYSYGTNTLYNGLVGTELTNLGNPNLSWQNVYKFNVGTDIELFKNRLDARFDYYIEDTKDALTQVTLPGSSGFSTYSENLGSIRNKGFEFALRYKILEDKSRRMFWSVNINGFTNKNILLKLSNRLKSANDQLDEANADQTTPNVLFKEGESINTLYVVRSLGVDPMTGSEVYLTKDGKPTYTWDAADKVAYGVTDPKWNGVFGTNFMLYGFEFNLIFNYRFGGKIYNQTLADRVESVDPTENVDVRAYTLGWTGPGDVSQFTRITTNKVPTKLTSRFVQQENYLNQSVFSVAYNFDPKSRFLKSSGLSACKLAFTSNDALQWSNVQIERGTSNPYTRTTSLSLRVTF
ncbi:SusC/RagA family TonB-linked outer membrane protein [Flavobacterium notoginsengisoli]|uniref:SusC/RagA family TonB-linked outer membrane protein n=1 Tax=Flavobacterium notoginsengisoli TaxID=1478199 RepID=UPI0036374C44